MTYGFKPKATCNVIIFNSFLAEIQIQSCKWISVIFRQTLSAEIWKPESWNLKIWKRLSQYILDENHFYTKMANDTLVPMTLSVEDVRFCWNIKQWKVGGGGSGFVNRLKSYKSRSISKFFFFFTELGQTSQEYRSKVKKGPMVINAQKIHKLRIIGESSLIRLCIVCLTQKKMFTKGNNLVGTKVWEKYIYKKNKVFFFF